MEQMALLQETAYERLYRWAQSKWLLSCAVDARVLVYYDFVILLGLNWICLDLGNEKVFLKRSKLCT